MSSNLKFSSVTFSRLDLPNLLINIWEYNDERHKNCPICKQYKEWCIQVVKTQWQNSYIDFDYFIENIKNQNRLFDFGKISSADRARIYGLIWKNRF